jgi:hypothetical protein
VQCAVSIISVWTLADSHCQQMRPNDTFETFLTLYATDMLELAIHFCEPHYAAESRNLAHFLFFYGTDIKTHLTQLCCFTLQTDRQTRVVDTCYLAALHYRQRRHCDTLLLAVKLYAVDHRNKLGGTYFLAETWLQLTFTLQTVETWRHIFARRITQQINKSCRHISI